MSDNPEIGSRLLTGDLTTNYHDVGEGPTVLLLHGSGPGVSAYANWRLTFASLSSRFRLLAPDLAGFGFTDVPADIDYTRERWLTQIIDFLDGLGVTRTHVVGNSFGGSMALALAIARPDLVDRMVLMGSVGVHFEITHGLDEVWGYEPSEATMGHLIRDVFAYDPGLVTDDLVRMRYLASIRPGVQEKFSSMFPAPRQRWVDAMAHDESAIRALGVPTLMVHGRDDKVIPVATSLRLHELIDDSQVHLFGRCGHWTQIERADEFARVVADFLTPAG